ncbi:MAG: hypothetical protein ABSH38_15205 [Verrucomicrobiota bacterium]
MNKHAEAGLTPPRHPRVTLPGRFGEGFGVIRPCNAGGRRRVFSARRHCGGHCRKGNPFQSRVEHHFFIVVFLSEILNHHFNVREATGIQPSCA